MASYDVRKILKAVADVRKHTPATARLCLVGPTDLLADAARMLSAGADDVAAGGVSAALDVLDRADFPTRPERLSRWSVVVFLEDAQSQVRPELGPTVASAVPPTCRRSSPRCATRRPCPSTVSMGRHGRPGGQGARASRPRHAGREVGARAAHSPGLRPGRVRAGRGPAGPAPGGDRPDHRRHGPADALVGAVIFLPGADMPVMTINQLKMVLRIGAAYGYKSDLQRTVEMLGVILSGFGMRAVARRAVDYVPGLGWAMKASFGYVGTEAIGRSAVAYFESGAPLTASRFPRLSGQLGKFERLARGIAR